MPHYPNDDEVRQLIVSYLVTTFCVGMVAGLMIAIALVTSWLTKGAP